MELPHFQLEFAGGPLDGLRLYCDGIPDRRLAFPVRCDLTGDELVAYRWIVKTNAVVYEFQHSTTAGKLANCNSVLHYSCVGFTTPTRRICPIKSSGMTGRVREWLYAATHGLMRCVRGWISESMTHPMQLSPSDCNQGSAPRSKSILRRTAS